MKNKILIAVFSIIGLSQVSAQCRLYSNTFSLGEVTLSDGPFRHACDLNINMLLEYDIDRLLAPYLREAGLAAKSESFPNWIGLDGHIGGHYLSAMAIHYAATGNVKCKERMEYIIAELKRCQAQNADGYVGGVPDGAHVWDEIKRGNTQIVWQAWVPWYNIHKTFAGLRDAWLYGDNNDAKSMFLKLCDWGLTVIEPLDDGQMEQMLANEFGGMNEVYADAYQMTGKEKYLNAAKRFSHKHLYESMYAQHDNLDNMHANTQVPKVVGYARTAEVGKDDAYNKAASYFWDRVVNYRSLSFGGNSRREHFPPEHDCSSYITDREGPEACNTNNMLKLTESLFRMNPDAVYADYYERALYNHILSSQHPEHGGYVYFTPARPAHYRVYSMPNSAMWCCVGTGMENHGKYGEFIYTHTMDSLFVNLFIPSELDWKAKKVKLVQETDFPNQEGSKLVVKVKKPTRFKLLVRHPGWATSGMKVLCNGVDYGAESSPSAYIVIDRLWKNGDVVEVEMPLPLIVEELINAPNYISIMKGPILLSAKMGDKGLDGLVADDSRWGHIAGGSLVSVFDTPIMLGTREEIVEKLNQMQPIAGKPLCYTVPGLFQDSKYDNLILEPFYSIHDQRYMMYWLSMSQPEFTAHQQELQEIEEQRLRLDRLTVDAVNTGEQQPEVDHGMKFRNSSSGYHEGEAWRDAGHDGFFEYTMTTAGEKDLSLVARYWGNDQPNRNFDILIDGVLLAEENIHGKWNRSEFVDVYYPLPQELIAKKDWITVTFSSKPHNIAGGVFNVRLVKNDGQ